MIPYFLSSKMLLIVRWASNLQEFHLPKKTTKSLNVCMNWK